MAEDGHPPAVPAARDGTTEVGPVRVRRQAAAQDGLRGGRASGWCPGRRRAGGRSSTAASSSCRATSTSAPASAPTRWSTPGPRSARARRSAPVSTCRGRRHRRRARAAERRARHGRRRRHDRQPVHGDPGRPGGRGRGAGEGTILNPSIPVIDAETGEELGRGVVPPWCVAVGARAGGSTRAGEFFLPCVLVIKRLDPGERHDKAQLEAVLREHEVAHVSDRRARPT